MWDGGSFRQLDPSKPKTAGKVPLRGGCTQNDSPDKVAPSREMDGGNLWR